MNDSLRIRLGAVTLALLTLAAMVFAALNFQQRIRFAPPDDGVAWVDTAQGVEALYVWPASPAAKAGIDQGDYVQSVNGVAIQRATDVTRVLWKSGPWAQVPYQIRRGDTSFRMPVITEPQENPSSIEDYLRITALLYLFIGLFIFVRRWNAPRAVHFYVFCLASFVLYSFHYTGKLNSFDWIVYWAQHRGAAFAARAAGAFRAGISGAPQEALAEAAGGYTACRRFCLLLHTFIATANAGFSCRRSAIAIFWRRWNWSTWPAIRWRRPEFSWRATSARPAAF